MTTTWHNLDPPLREAHMNPRVAVGNAAAEASIAGYAERSRVAREKLDGHLDVRFGVGEKATFDLFRPRTPGPHPAYVFIHGGYWRALDKDQHSFVAEPAVAAGFATAVVNYDLCPAVTLDDIVAQMRAFMGYFAREAPTLGLMTDAIDIAGHSAGAHLAAMLMHDPGPEPTLPIRWAGLASGIFEPAAILELSINLDVRLTPDMAARNDALTRLPRARPHLELTVGGAEPPAWIAQSGSYAAAARAAGHEVTYEVVDGADHFTLLHRPLVPPLRDRTAGGA